jgi:hypothetical protein
VKGDLSIISQANVCVARMRKRGENVSWHCMVKEWSGFLLIFDTFEIEGI